MLQRTLSLQHRIYFSTLQLNTSTAAPQKPSNTSKLQHFSTSMLSADDACACCLHFLLPPLLLLPPPPPLHFKPNLNFNINFNIEKNCSDWIKISEMLLGPVPEGFKVRYKHILLEV
jgi:hypothetical protein